MFKLVKSTAWGLIALGLSQSVAMAAGWQKDDGADHTIPRVPAGVAMGPGLTTTVAISNGLAYTWIANTVTGDEHRVPPLDSAKLKSISVP